MTNPSSLVITGLDGYFILNFLQKSGFYHFIKGKFPPAPKKSTGSGPPSPKHVDSPPFFGRFPPPTPSPPEDNPVPAL